MGMPRKSRSKLTASWLGRQPTGRSGFTLLELLVVIAILGALIAMLLPAVQASRETGRRTVCLNNLKQVSLALLSHHTSHQRFPSGGWGHEWVGVPGRGSRESQPGGWIYNILPYLDQPGLHELGIGLTGTAADEAYATRLMTPIEIFVCPSRRSCDLWEVAEPYWWVASPKPFGHVRRVARSDYAINGGSTYVLSFPGPPTIEEGERSSFWIDHPKLDNFSGISHLRVATSLFAIHDGIGHTYMLGEKSIDPQHYEDGLSRGDNESLYSGYCTDLHRFAGFIEWLRTGSPPWIPPMADGNEKIEPKGYLRFGSAHPSGFLMAFCDGSVRNLEFALDPEVHLRAGHRSDRGRALKAMSLKLK
jgi:prepilin-type N-terminal cleavage/methylation domain-containing protein